MIQEEALDALLQLIPNTTSGNVSLEQAKTEVLQISKDVRDDGDWNYLTGEIEHQLKPRVGLPGPDGKEYRTWLQIRDKERDDRCAAMRRKAARELGMFGLR